MRASKFIYELNKLIEAHGDVEVLIMSDDNKQPDYSPVITLSLEDDSVDSKVSHFLLCDRDTADGMDYE